MKRKTWLVTYATHEEGMFRDLVENPYVKVTVLGFGTKWKGFFDKIRAVFEFLTNGEVGANDFVIVVDGFDTQLKADPANAVKIYSDRYSGKGVVVSKHPDLFGIPPLDLYVKWRLFRGGSINAGLYMGRAIDVRKMLRGCMKYLLSAGEKGR